jgi:hypothetical protein
MSFASTDESELQLLAPPRRPLRVMFVNTSLEVGGAETLLVNLVRRMDREQFAPEICCLKEKGALGEMLADEVPVFSDLLRSKYDLRILGRLTRLFRERQLDAVVTPGASARCRVRASFDRLAGRRRPLESVANAIHGYVYRGGGPTC